MKKIIPFILIIISSISVVSAKSINDLYNELNSLETKKNLYNYLTSDEINNILSASLDIEIVIDTLNDEINNINKNIEAKEKNIDKLNEEVNNYLVFNQITGGENIYLEYIFSSEDYTDMIYRYMVVERLTNYNNNLIEKLNKEIKELYAYFDFPVLPEELKAEDIVKETRHDKKMEHGKIKFILLDKVGEATIYQDVTPEEMLTVLERVWKIIPATCTL